VPICTPVRRLADSPETSPGRPAFDTIGTAMARVDIAGLLLSFAWLLACGGAGAGSGPSENRADPAPATVSTATPPDFVKAGEGQTPKVVRDALRMARQQGRQLVVYVGATWCEPCQAFHHAVERGELDGALDGVRFVEFDADLDKTRLLAAGYQGRYIPRFVLPGEDGRGTDRRSEGGIKGEGAVANIMERLLPLLARGDR
jgi:thiol-disulfide isomerase/thioredoxin